MSNSSLLEPVAGDHIVKFHDEDASLLSMLTAYIRGGLASGGAGIVIAAPGRLAHVRAALAAVGEDVGAVEAGRRLILLDADETLARFEVDGELDIAEFDRVVGRILRVARAAGDGKLYVYGEMVARLWDRGAVPAAIELERLWNDLGTRLPFALFCAYPARILNDPDAAQSFNDVCACHTQVVDGAPKLEVEVARRFPATPYAARLARQFVRAHLEQWGYGGLVDDASLVVAELTANATAYGGCDFTCGVSRSNTQVRIEVGDSSAALPVKRAIDSRAVNGRGLHLVDAVAGSWGWTAASSGKVVWAEFENQALRQPAS